MTDPYVGKKLGNYDIEELVGKGGMASVYRARQPSMNRSVAIKVMARQYGDDPAFVQRFQNEAQLIAQLEHAHILPVYDFGEQEGNLYIVMRYLSAGTLGDRIPSGGMPVKEAVAYFRQLASALDYAHQSGVIHRDLKPGNVMLDQQGNTFLTDFGIAKSLQNESNLTGTGGVVGTPTYMSPEQGLGEPLDGRSDIYALGVILFEMLSGRPPFTADNPMAVMLKHINDAPPSLREIRPDITQAVEAVVMRALAKDPNTRYRSALEMADAFDEAVRTGSVPVAAAAFTDPSSTLSGLNVPASPAGIAGKTMQSPVAGAAATTSELGAAGAPTAMGGIAAAPTVAPTPIVPDVIPVTLNSISRQLAGAKWLGQWLQAGLLSLATFLILAELTSSAALPEVAALSLLPGIIYGLLRNPTLGSLISFVLILVPLAARAPALAILWTGLFVVAASRLNSREIMLILVTIVAAQTPIGWVVPLLAPWWLKARRTVLAVALGVTYATLFALTLNWSPAGGLLPIPAEEVDVQATIGLFDTTYFGLLEPSAWTAWTDDPNAVVQSILSTFTAIGGVFASTGGLPLVIATSWALASVLSVSNSHSENPVLRGLGLGLGLAILLVTHLVLRTSAGVELPSVTAILLGILGAILAVLLSQWPIQADPNQQNKIGTVLRTLRSSMGALFMALGVAYFARELAGTPFYDILWIGGIAGTLTMITNAVAGPPIVFASLAAAYWPVDPTKAIVVAVLLFAYLVVNLLFDRRRPRTWNPLGAGLMLGSPGMALAGLLPLGPLSIGALEAQVPAAIFAALAHVLLVATAREINPFAIVVQLITTLFGVLLVERLMATELLSVINPRLRRLAFTTGLALLMAISYYGIGRTETTVGNVAPLIVAVVVSVLSAAAMVAAMGKRAEYWREFVEKEETEADELEDEEVTNTARRKAAAGAK